MIEVWVIVAATAALLKPTYQALQKRATNTYSPLAITQFTYLVTAVAALIATVALQPSLPTLQAVFITVGIGAANSLGLYAFVRAIRQTDLSIVSPFQQTIPIFVAIFEPIVLPVVYSTNVLLGALLTVIGAYVILADVAQPLGPLKRIRERGPLLALFTAITFAATSIASRTVLDTLPVYVFLLIATTAAFTVMTLLRGGTAPPTSLNRWLVACGFIYAINLGFTYLAFALTTASNATIVFRLGLPLSVIIGVIAFDEQHLWVRLAGATIILIAIAVVIFG